MAARIKTRHVVAEPLWRSSLKLKVGTLVKGAALVYSAGSRQPQHREASFDVAESAIFQAKPVFGRSETRTEEAQESNRFENWCANHLGDVTPKLLKDSLSENDFEVVRENFNEILCLAGNNYIPIMKILRDVEDMKYTSKVRDGLFNKAQLFVNERSTIITNAEEIFQIVGYFCDWEHLRNTKKYKNMPAMKKFTDDELARITQRADTIDRILSKRKLSKDAVRQIWKSLAPSDHVHYLELLMPYENWESIVLHYNLIKDVLPDGIGLGFWKDPFQALGLTAPALSTAATKMVPVESPRRTHPTPYGNYSSVSGSGNNSAISSTPTYNSNANVSETHVTKYVAGAFLGAGE